MRVTNYQAVNLNGHDCSCCCDCCAVNATMDPTTPTVSLPMMNAGVQTLAPNVATNAAPPQSVYDRSATLGDLATLIGVLSALFYIFRGR